MAEHSKTSGATLDYNTVLALSPKLQWLRGAQICAFGAAGFGTAIFAIFLVNPSNALAMIGLIFLFVFGLPMFAVGMCLLIAYAWRRFRIHGSLWPDRRTVITAGMLLANFPLAALYCSIGDKIASTITVTIFNRSDETLRDVRLTFPGGSRSLDAIPPAESRKMQFRLDGEGTIQMSAQSAGSRVNVMIESYAADGFRRFAAYDVDVPNAPATATASSKRPR